jgi:aarF domain-containing kinase
MRIRILWLLLGLCILKGERVASSVVFPRDIPLTPKPWHVEQTNQPKVGSVRAELIRQWDKRTLSQSPAPYLLATSCLMAGRVATSEPARRALYFWRHAGPMVVHYKFTEWWLGKSEAPLERRNHVYGKLHDRYSEPSLQIILHLKGLYVKIGQIMSSRPDFVPEQYVRLFATVQDSIPQWPVSQVRDIISQSFRSEFGLEWDDVFESMDPVALGSASIGQVHRAVLKDSWAEPYQRDKTVAVKVMHPGAKQRFSHDFVVFRWLCRLALPGWSGFLVELERQIMTEFDYRDEAVSLQDVRQNMMQSPYKSRVAVPEPFKSLCSKYVLVMEMLPGKKLAEAVEDNLALAFGGDRALASTFLAAKQEEILFGSDSSRTDSILASCSLLVKVRLFLFHQKYKRFVDLLVDVHGHQIFLDGCFNGDSHPGNCLDCGDGRLGLIDYGQTRRLGDNDRLALSEVIVALGKGSNTTAIADSMRKLGFTTNTNDDLMMSKYATIFFDCDTESKRLGFATPQQYFASLMNANALVTIPDAAGTYHIT